ncbi:MAG: NB-ARC domain-containing protein, partial [Caldimonas sp.]
MDGVRALVVTDVVDSVLISARLGDEQASRWWAAHHRLARDLLRRWRGREIDSSDGFLLMFEGVGDALQFAFEYHRAIADLQPPIQARVGVHAAPFVVRENSAEDVARGAKTLEIDGVAKMIAARTMAVARGNQTLLTRETHDSMPAGPVRVVSHGHWRIKGIDEPIQLFAASDDTVAIEPPPETEKAYRVVRSEDIWIPLREVRHSLLPERDSFVGRQGALHALRRSFEAGSRLVSVLGVGGVGKTRLAQRFGWSCLGDFPGGVWFADLSQARTRDGICFALAQSLDTIPGPSDDVSQLGKVLAGRGRCLVVLDNFEQVVKHAVDTVVPWLDMAPQAHFLVTSRENLSVPGEMVLRLGTLEHEDAEELFTRRAE